MYELSIILPGNNEMFTSRTVEDILKNKRAKTEIIVVLDGGIWADPPIDQHPDVNVIYIPNTIGQRAATNVGVRLSGAKYVAKADCHCSFDEGFDQKMLDFFKIVGDDVTGVPIMRNLWAYDWKCHQCGWKKYQGPTPLACEKCGCRDKIKRKMMWVGKPNPQSTSFSFDSEPHFQYFEDWKHRPQYIKDKAEKGYTETMSLQGSFFMCTREKYWELKLSDEAVGSWGNQGIELACKTWLSGGRVLVNHKTWYAHMFRTQGGDFGFPYEQSGKGVQKTKQKVWDHFFGGRFKQQIHPVSWLIERFSPVPGWTSEKIAELKVKEK